METENLDDATEDATNKVTENLDDDEIEWLKKEVKSMKQFIEKYKMERELRRNKRKDANKDFDFKLKVVTYILYRAQEAGEFPSESSVTRPQIVLKYLEIVMNRFRNLEFEFWGHKRRLIEEALESLGFKKRLFHKRAIGKILNVNVFLDKSIAAWDEETQDSYIRLFFEAGDSYMSRINIAAKRRYELLKSDRDRWKLGLPSKDKESNA